MLSINEYEALAPRGADLVEFLGGELDDLIARMQAPEATAAGRALFEASPRKMGRAARAAGATTPGAAT